MQWMMNKIPISWYIYSCLAMRQRESFSAFSGFSMPALERASTDHCSGGVLFLNMTMACAAYLPMYGCLASCSSGSFHNGYGVVDDGFMNMRSFRPSYFSWSKCQMSISCSGYEYPPSSSR